MPVTGPTGVTKLTVAGQIFVKNTLSNFVKIRQTVYMLLPGSRQTDGWTDGRMDGRTDGRGPYVGRSFKARSQNCEKRLYYSLSVGVSVCPSVRLHETTLLTLHRYS